MKAYVDTFERYPDYSVSRSRPHPWLDEVELTEEEFARIEKAAEESNACARLIRDRLNGGTNG